MYTFFDLGELSQLYLKMIKNHIISVLYVSAFNWNKRYDKTLCLAVRVKWYLIVLMNIFGISAGGTYSNQSCRGWVLQVPSTQRQQICIFGYQHMVLDKVCKLVTSVMAYCSQKCLSL